MSKKIEEVDFYFYLFSYIGEELVIISYYVSETAKDNSTYTWNSDVSEEKILMKI